MEIGLKLYVRMYLCMYAREHVCVRVHLHGFIIWYHKLLMPLPYNELIISLTVPRALQDVIFTNIIITDDSNYVNSELCQ